MVDFDWMRVTAQVAEHPELLADEIPVAVAALNSPIAAIREHARHALEWFEKRTGQQVLLSDRGGLPSR